MESALQTYTLPEAFRLLDDFFKVPPKAKGSWKKLFHWLSGLDETTQRAIIDAASARPGSKRKRFDTHVTSERSRKRSRLQAVVPSISHSLTGESAPTIPATVSASMSPEFLSVPDEQIVESCIAKFIDLTGNDALSKKTCVVCARRLFANQFDAMYIKDIPNAHLLSPTHPHPHQTTLNGSLFHSTVSPVGLNDVCHSCLSTLKRCSRPRLALANNMWIGDVPFQLQILTLPEQLLVALYFPAAYIVKIYPGKIRFAPGYVPNGGVDPIAINEKLRGNVSTFRLPTSQIAEMVGGNLVPQPPLILASLIGVTFVGVGRSALPHVKGIFRVRRQRVLDALTWLKANNRLYSDVLVNLDTINALPEDDVPHEIAENIRYSTDVDAVGREHAGYVPPDIGREDGLHDDMGSDEDFEVESDEDDRIDMSQHDFSSNSENKSAGHLHETRDYSGTLNSSTNDIGPSVFPLHVHGVLDVGGDNIPDSTVFSHAVNNLVSGSFTRDYAVRRGSAFINEYGRRDENNERFDGGPSNANHLLGAFPTLFPYGLGGFEVDREDNVSYEEHVKWALQHDSGRFRKHTHFIFQVFGVLQKRQVCRSASIQIDHNKFLAVQSSLRQLTPQDLLKASEEESNNVPISNPLVRLLRKHLSAIRARVQGTDENRIAIRAQIWGMTLKYNPPSIWMTINLSDTNDPIAQVLAGQEIDLDKFNAKAGPTATARDAVMATDPFAAAEYFHFVIRLILAEMLGIAVGERGAITRREGVLGTINGYIGTVEAQARGSLHLHLLLWLKGSPTASKMQEALKSPEFRNRVKHFIKHNIRADVLGGALPPEATKRLRRSVAFSRPVDPRRMTYKEEAARAERVNASVLQYHECTPYYCLKNKSGRMICKRGHPWPTYKEDWVDERGNWGPKRSNCSLNAWNPPIFHTTRSNMDIKLLTNAWETKDIAFYITLYIAKKQVQAANASAILAKSHAFRDASTLSSETPIHKVNKKLLQQCANTLSRQYELSGPEVVGYLMGWGDRYISHTFVKIFWDPIVATLHKTYPHLSKKALPYTNEDQTTQYNSHLVRVILDHGEFSVQDQLSQYTDRGEQLESFNMYDFFLYTYHTSGGGTGADDEESPTLASSNRRPGRPKQPRIPYLEDSGRKGARVVRGPKQETALHIIGRWLPSKDTDNPENYAAQILVLLKPWRKLSDLTDQNASFVESLRSFVSNASDEILRLMENIEYYHECSKSANRKKDTNIEEDESEEPLEYEDGQEHLPNWVYDTDAFQPLREEDVERAREGKYSAAEQAYGKKAMQIAKAARILDPPTSTAMQKDPERNATEEEMSTFGQWEQKVASITRKLYSPQSTEYSPEESNESSKPHKEKPRKSPQGSVTGLDEEYTMLRTIEQQQALDILNIEQRRAHDIVEQHLRRHLKGEEQDQLLMIVQGEGGTGKTVLLNAISHTFDFLHSSRLLAKTGTTGISASLVKGCTLHQWAGIPVSFSEKENWLQKAGKKIQLRRLQNILPTQYLTIDEFSMLTKKTLAQLSQIISFVKATQGSAPASKAFGNINVILFGDPHQFPPVGNPRAALYNSDPDLSLLGQLGLAFYRQFDVVITLTEQKRVRDVEWNRFLRRLRSGSCTEEDMVMLKSLMVEGDSSIRWTEDPWKDAVLVTPRHLARTMWNSAALNRHHSLTGNLIYLSNAEDVVSRPPRPLTMEERVIVAGLRDKKAGKLDEKVEISIGMRAMVIWNISTEADLANGTRGTIIGLKLDPREPPNLQKDANNRVLLRFPPAIVLIKIDQFSHQAFESLQEGVLPIFPTSTSFGIETKLKTPLTIRRRQYALTPAYAFTDYKSQGQTIAMVIVDLENPPRGRFTPFNAYVALSRSHGRDTIRILRGFDPKIFTTHPSQSLKEEDDRLEKLTKETQQKYPVTL